MPLDFQLNREDGGLMAVWKITEPEEELSSQLELCELGEKQLKIITSPEKRLEWMASRILVAQLANDNRAVRYRGNGKPFLEGSELDLSISHTVGLAAVVTTSVSKAGIDIEIPSARISRVAHRFLHEEEESFIPPGEKEKYLALIWCAKETLYKMANQPGLIFKDDLRIEPFTANPKGVLSCMIYRDGNKDSYGLHYMVNDGYCLVWHW